MQVPLQVLLDSEEAFVFNIQLPNPKAAADSMAFKIRYILDQLMRAAFGQKARQVSWQQFPTLHAGFLQASGQPTCSWVPPGWQGSNWYVGPDGAL
jgi:hypothetical protein